MTTDTITPAPQTLPWSEAAEQHVIGALLFDNRALDRIDTLSESDFFAASHQAIFGVIVSLLAGKKPADIVTVWERLQATGKGEEVGGLAYVNDLAQGVPSATNIRRHAAIVREKAAHRALIAAADEALNIAKGDIQAADAVDQIATLFAGLQRTHTRQVPKAIAEVALQRTAYYEDVQAGKIVPGWRTHIPALTQKLNGGFRAGGLYILAARPSVGKSSLASELGINFAADGLTTLFLSQEMPNEEVADRTVANIGHIDLGALLGGKMDPEHWHRATEALTTMSERQMFVDDQSSLTLRDIRAKAKSVPGLKVLILDYLQLCASTRKDGNRNSEIEEISRGLKTLAKEMGIAVLALSQLNRDVEKRTGRRPGLGDLRDSGAIEQDADVVMFLWPVRELSDGTKLLGFAVEKNRQGSCGAFALEFVGNVQRWYESALSIEAPAMPAKPHKEM